MLDYKKIAIKDNYPEFMFSLFMSLFSLVKPITQPTGYSGVLLFSISLICIFLLFNKVNKFNIKGNWVEIIIISAIFMTLLLIDAVFRYNENIVFYLYDFSLYAILPFIFVTYVKNYKAVLWYYSIFTILNGIIYIPDAMFNNYELSGSYMQFGFNNILPAISGCGIMFFYFKRKIGLLLLILFGLLSFIYANKGAVLAGAILTLFGYLYVYKNGRIKFTQLALIVSLYIVISSNLNSIISKLISFASILGVADSYALRTLDAMLLGYADTVMQARYDIYDVAWHLINQKPFFGWGVGWFEKFSEAPYPHNFFLEILIDYGWVGTIVFSLLFFYSIFVIRKKGSFEFRVFSFMMLFLWAIPLFSSLTFWRVMPFWIYWYLSFCNHHYIKSEQCFRLLKRGKNNIAF